MKPSFQSMFGFVGLLWCGLPPAGDLFGQAAPAAEAVAVIKEFRGNGVQVSSQPGVWKPALTNQALYAGNVLRTDTNSHALVQFSPLATARVAGRGSLSMRQPSGKKRGFDLLK